MSRAKTAAAVEAAIPEIGITSELAQRLLSRTRTSEKQKIEVSNRVVVIPPQEHVPLLETRRARVRVIERKGVTIVIPEPAKGLTAKELIAAIAIAGIGVAGYVAAEDIERWEKSRPKAGSANWWLSGGPLNPENW
jgi:hypothetical protein